MIAPLDRAFLDQATGGEYSNVRAQLGRLELYLQISIGVTTVAAVAALALIFRRRG